MAAAARSESEARVRPVQRESVRWRQSAREQLRIRRRRWGFKQRFVRLPSSICHAAAYGNPRAASEEWRPRQQCVDPGGHHAKYYQPGVPVFRTQPWGSHGARGSHAQRQHYFFLQVMVQWFALRLCYEAVEAHEARRGARYDWLLRTRTDLVFVTPTPLAAPLSRAHAYVPIGGMSGDESCPPRRGSNRVAARPQRSTPSPHRDADKCLNDHVFLCPRRLCRPYFTLLELFSSERCVEPGRASPQAIYAERIAAATRTRWSSRHCFTSD